MIATELFPVLVAAHVERIDSWILFLSRPDKEEVIACVNIFLRESLSSLRLKQFRKSQNDIYHELAKCSHKTAHAYRSHSLKNQHDDVRETAYQGCSDEQKKKSQNVHGVLI
jgi:hypothetical protein